jgi:hypothetical protein
VERAETRRRKYEYCLEACLKELDTLCQQNAKEISAHQVSERGFSPLQTRIIHFHLPILEESEPLWVTPTSFS